MRSNENSFSKVRLGTDIENIDIRKYLPHRKPMLMVDKLQALTNTKVETKFRISKENIFLKGNTFIESGLIENIAQTCSTISGSAYFQFEGEQKIEDIGFRILGFISKIEHLEIFELPKVNDTLISVGDMISEVSGDGFSICKMNGKIFCNDHLILECRLNLFLKKIENESE